MTDEAPPLTLTVCVNRRMGGNANSCAGRGSEALATALEEAAVSRDSGIIVERGPCLGFCTMGPNVRIHPPGEFKHRVKTEEAEALLDELEQLRTKD